MGDMNVDEAARSVTSERDKAMTVIILDWIVAHYYRPRRRAIFDARRSDRTGKRARGAEWRAKGAIAHPRKTHALKER